MNKAKKDLLGGTITYFIGNVLTSLLQLLLLRFVTGKLLPEDYGYYNLIITIDQLVTPVITLQISDAVFRFFFDDTEEARHSVYTNAIIVLLVGFFVMLAAAFIFHVYIQPINHFAYVIAYMISTNVYQVYQKVTRAMGHSVDFVKCGLLKSVLYIILQLICLYVFNLKVESLFISFILSTIISLLVLESKIRQRAYFRISAFNKKLLKKMIAFSLPLAPNTIFWWLNSSVNSMIMTMRLGLDATGIYSVAGKFANVLNLATSVFGMAWQEASIKAVNDEGRTAFYNDIFNLLIKALFSLLIIGIPLVGLVMPYMIDSKYYEALLYAPILLIATGFSAISGFFGQMYSALKKTTGAMNTTIYGMVFNLLFVFTTIKHLNILAPVLSVLFTNIIMAFVRYMYFRKEMELSPSYKLLFYFLMSGISLILYYLCSPIANAIYVVILFPILILANKTVLQKILKIIFKRK